MFNFMIDLFTCLNLSIKNINYFKLDDFLYFMDNLSFYLEDDSEFERMLRKCFI